MVLYLMNNKFIIGVIIYCCYVGIVQVRKKVERMEKIEGDVVYSLIILIKLV